MLLLERMRLGSQIDLCSLLRLDFTLLCRHVGLPHFLFLSLPSTEARVRYDLVTLSCTISISETRILQYSVLGELRSPST